MLIHNKDDIQFVTEFPCFWDTLYEYKETGDSINSIQSSLKSHLLCVTLYLRDSLKFMLGLDIYISEFKV